MATARPVKIGKGLLEKRARILRSLDAHIGYLATVETMAPWEPPVRAPWPPRQLPSFHQRHTPRYVYPRARPELAHPCPGPEAITDDQIKEWLAEDPFVRGGLSPQTARALTFIATFAPKVRA